MKGSWVVRDEQQEGRFDYEDVKVVVVENEGFVIFKELLRGNIYFIRMKVQEKTLIGCLDIVKYENIVIKPYLKAQEGA